MKTNRHGLAAAAVLCLGALGLGGCNNALEGGATGAGLGALAGMGLGSLSGHMGAGAAAGAILGGVGGAIVGDQNQRAGSYVDYGHSYYGPPRYYQDDRVYYVPGHYEPGYYVRYRDY